MPRGIPKIKREKRTKEPAGEPKEPTIITDADEEFGAPIGHEDPIGLDEGVDRAPIFKMLLNPLFLMCILSIAGMYLIVNTFAVTDGRYTRDITRLELDLVDDRAALATVDGAINGRIIDLTSAQDSIRTRFNNLLDIALVDGDLTSYATKAALATYATKAKLADYATKANLESYVPMASFDTYEEDITDSLTSFEETMTDMSDRITGTNSDNTHEIDRLDGVISAVNIKADTLTGRVNGIETAMGNITGDLWFTLTGDDGEYVLDVGSSEGGTFMGRMTLLYDPPVALTGNITAYCDALACFYDMLNNPSRRYSPTTVWNGTTWELSRIEVYTSAFTLGTDSESSFVIALDGLGTLPMHKAFIEVLEGTSAAEGGGGSI